MNGPSFSSDRCGTLQVRRVGHLSVRSRYTAASTNFKALSVCFPRNYMLTVNVSSFQAFKELEKPYAWFSQAETNLVKDGDPIVWLHTTL